jgi:hypothetical protein
VSVYISTDGGTGEEERRLRPKRVGGRGGGQRPSVTQAEDPCPLPTAVGDFRGERVFFAKPPPELAQRYYALPRWAENSIGRQSPSATAPESLAEALRDVFSGTRTAPGDR